MQVDKKFGFFLGCGSAFILCGLGSSSFLNADLDPDPHLDPGAGPGPGPA